MKVLDYHGSITMIICAPWIGLHFQECVNISMLVVANKIVYTTYCYAIIYNIYIIKNISLRHNSCGDMNTSLIMEGILNTLSMS